MDAPAVVFDREFSVGVAHGDRKVAKSLRGRLSVFGRSARKATSMLLRNRPHGSPAAGALAVGVLLVAIVRPSIAQPAARSVDPPRPVFIVCARTDIADQGAPTLDILDFEHYLAQRLTAKGMPDVSPSATTEAADALSADAYLLDVVVQTMRVGSRPTWNRDWQRYDEHGVFDVDLLLAVRHLRSGRSIGSPLPERDEHWFVGSDASEQLAEKRAALLSAADGLADRFFAELQDGRFGPELSFPRPRSTAEQFLAEMKRALTQPEFMPALRWVGIVLGTVLFVVCAHSIARRVSEMARRRAKLRERALECLDQALSLQLKTGGFSDDACRAAAAARRQRILDAHSEIERKEAQRIREARAFEEGYAQTARLAGKEAAFDRRQLIDALRKAHGWEYRVLQEAKRQAVEESAR